MGMIDRVRAAWTVLRSHENSAITAGELNDESSASFVALLGSKLRSGTAIGETAAMSVPAVLRALEILCGVFAMTPMIYYRRLPDGGKERAIESPLFDLFHLRPNSIQSAFAFKEVLLGDLLMQGKFGSFIHRGPLYRPTALTRLNPLGIAVNQQWDKNDGHELFFDVSLPNGARERLTRNDVWYLTGFSRDGLLGLERLKLMSDTIAAAAATSRFAARFWENNAQPSTILTSKQKVNREKKDEIRKDWKDRFRGSDRAGEVAVVDQEMDVKFLSPDNKSSQFIEVRTFNVLEVARAWGVPPHLLYELSRATFSNIEQQSLEFITFHMMPHYERVAAAATHAFAEPDHFFEFLPDALLKGDIKSRYEAYGIAIDKGIQNPDEVRLKENMNRRPGGDEYRVGSGSTLERDSASEPVDHRSPAPQPKPDEEDE